MDTARMTERSGLFGRLGAPAKRRILPSLAVAAFMLMLVIRPDYFLASASKGLLLFASTVLPAIFPFFFCSSLLTAMGAANAVSALGARPVRALFNAPPQGAYVLVLSMLSGYPVGAATVADLFAKGCIDREGAKRISAFTSTSGPVFVLGTVGSAIFGDPAVGAVILAAHYLSAFTCGLIFRGKKRADSNAAALPLIDDADSALQRSIASSTLAMLAVGGYIVVGNMLIDALTLTGAEALINSLPELGGNMLEAFLFGAVEMTRGTMAASEISRLPLAVATAASIVSFGGLSVLLQSHVFLSRCGIRFSSLFVRKLVQSIAAFIYAVIFSQIFFTIL